MNRNTITTLGLLRVGDRFCYPGKKEVWQVVTYVGKGKVAVNQFDGQGQRIHYWDTWKSDRTPVKFLRHTVLEFSDECPIEMLEPGDVFTLLDNIVIEYMVREQFNDKTGKECKAVKQDGSKDFVFFPHGTEVVFIKKTK